MSVDGSGRAVLVWTMPASNGGRPVASYKVSYVASGVPAESVTVTKTRAVITGLDSTLVYTFTVSARNVYGQGAELSRTS